ASSSAPSAAQGCGPACPTAAALPTEQKIAAPLPCRPDNVASRRTASSAGGIPHSGSLIATTTTSARNSSTACATVSARSTGASQLLGGSPSSGVIRKSPMTAGGSSVESVRG